MPSQPRRDVVPNALLDLLAPFGDLGRDAAEARLAAIGQFAREMQRRSEEGLTPAQARTKLERIGGLARALRGELETTDHLTKAAVEGSVYSPVTEVAASELDDAAARAKAPNNEALLRRELGARISEAMDLALRAARPDGPRGEGLQRIVNQAADLLVSELPLHWSGVPGWIRRLEGLASAAELAARQIPVKQGGGSSGSRHARTFGPPRAAVIREGVKIFSRCRPGAESTYTDGALVEFLDALLTHVLPEQQSTREAIQTVLVRRKLVPTERKPKPSRQKHAPAP